MGMAGGKEAYVFGLDIGTRSIVGTVGYRDRDQFYVVAQALKEHETRAMLDGQIHDIAKVSGTISEVKEELEKKTKRKLKDVCIAAAGRVLKTETVSVSMEFEEDTLVTDEVLYELDSAGVEKAYERFQNENKDSERFYCVGHTVTHYQLNGHAITSLLNHKAKQIGMDLIATFLPYDVVEGLYTSVEMAGLEVANLTLEPIAAIEVAIPEKFRMLNIALVDVGAGTSDICITKDGSVAAYGMIPIAGDSLTEVISQHCLTEFAEAEKIKKAIEHEEFAEYEDIMGLTQTISKEEVLSLLDDQIEEMTQAVSDQIIALNGDKPVSAIFVVGGGGRIEGYTSKLADKMGIQVQRVALRGEDVMGKIVFEDDTLTRDSMLITPLGICLNFYEQNNNFIYVQFNEERLKLYDNGKLTVVDAVMQAGISNEDLFPKRGKPLRFYLNGEEKVIKGQLGEPAAITINGENADLHADTSANDIIRLFPSTAGEDGAAILSKLSNSKGRVEITVNGKNVTFPTITTVNSNLESENYEIKEGDRVEVQDYCTVKQVLTFLDLTLGIDQSVYVNEKVAEEETKVYNKFNFDIRKNDGEYLNYGDKEESGSEDGDLGDRDLGERAFGDGDSDTEGESGRQSDQKAMAGSGQKGETPASAGKEKNDTAGAVPLSGREPVEIGVIVNNAPVFLKGKASYVYVDVFDFIDFDLSKPQGAMVVTNLNGKQAQYMEPIKEGDVLEIYWKD